MQVQGICRAKVRLDADAIMGGNNPQDLATALTQLQRLKVCHVLVSSHAVLAQLWCQSCDITVRLVRSGGGEGVVCLAWSVVIR